MCPTSPPGKFGAKLMGHGATVRNSKVFLVAMFAVLCCLLVPRSGYAFSLVIDWSAADSVDARRIKGVLAEHNVEPRLHRFVEQTFVLKGDVVIVMYSGEELFLDSEKGITYVPLQILSQLEARITERYARPHIRDKVLSAAVEQLLWVELGKALVSQFSLPIQGQPAYAVDGFATVMLLNLHASIYLLDAAEEYLVVDQSHDALLSDGFQSELEFDQSRYQLIVCTVVGKDFDRFQDDLRALGWTAERRKQCERRYHRQLTDLYQAMRPYLKPQNKIRYWLPEIAFDTPALD